MPAIRHTTISSERGNPCTMFIMATERTLTIGTRGSALALKQADIVTCALKAADASIDVKIRIIETHGDVNQGPIPLDTIGKGWFTKEIESALLSGEIDLAVHSLKDMADDMPDGLHIGAYLPREDARDVLVTKHGEPLEELRSGAVIGTDSARRQIQMKALRPDVVMQSLRGNVIKRLEKLASEPYDAIILAAAGLKRLGLEARINHYFEPDEMTPSPGQGTLAVQIKRDRPGLQELLSAINDIDVARAAHIERSFSRVVGGGCKSPTGAYAARVGEDCLLTAMMLRADGTIYREKLRAPWSDCEHLGETLARTMQSARINGSNA